MYSLREAARSNGVGMVDEPKLNRSRLEYHTFIHA